MTHKREGFFGSEHPIEKEKEKRRRRGRDFPNGVGFDYTPTRPADVALKIQDFYGLPIVFDGSLGPGEIQLRGPDGKVHFITEVAVDKTEHDKKRKIERLEAELQTHRQDNKEAWDRVHKEIDKVKGLEEKIARIVNGECVRLEREPRYRRTVAMGAGGERLALIPDPVLNDIPVIHDKNDAIRDLRCEIEALRSRIKKADRENIQLAEEVANLKAPGGELEYLRDSNGKLLRKNRQYTQRINDALKHLNPYRVSIHDSRMDARKALLGRDDR